MCATVTVVDLVAVSTIFPLYFATDLTQWAFFLTLLVNKEFTFAFIIIHTFIEVSLPGELVVIYICGVTY